jgi:hypothetical protein
MSSVLKCESIFMHDVMSSHYDRWDDVFIDNAVILCIPRLDSPVCTEEILKFDLLDVPVLKYILSCDTPEHGSKWYGKPEYMHIKTKHLFLNGTTMLNNGMLGLGILGRINPVTGDMKRTALFIKDGSIVDDYNVPKEEQRDMDVIKARCIALDS